MGEKIKRTEKVFKINQKDHAQGHIIPDVQSWLKLGSKGLLQKYQIALKKEQDNANRTFYQSVSISLEGSIIFIKRYSDIALQLAGESSNVQAKVHFSEIARICTRLTEKRPDLFHEAVQSVWFLFVLLHLESNASSFSPGRMVQYLFPFYRKDIDSVKLTMEKAIEIICCLWLKFNEIVYMRNKQSAKYFAGFPNGFNVAIGGLDESGQPAENELSYLMLKAQEILGLPQPNLSARIGTQSPVEFIESCVRVIAKGSGMPQLFNDDAIIPAIDNQGIKRDHALDYAVVGCVELSTKGNSLGWSDVAMFNMVKVIELTINNG